MALQIGERIGNRYVIEQYIGQGGMSTVYLARDEQLKRTVAVRVLNTVTSENKNRFLREAQIVTSLNHPNILAVYDINQDKDTVYFVLQYVGAGNLDEYIRTKGQLAISDTLNILRQIADALDYAHSLGVVHRDVKPSNILLDDKGKAYLSDFGVAKAVDSINLTSTGAFVGTPLYMSPEQGRGDMVNRSSDIYSFGVMAFYMLTGQPPFISDAPMGILLKHINEPVPALSSLNPAFSTVVDEVFKTVLAKDPEERFPNAVDFVRALTMALEGGKVLPAPAKSMPSPSIAKNEVVSASGKRDVMSPFIGEEAQERLPASRRSFASIFLILSFIVLIIVMLWSWQSVLARADGTQNQFLALIFTPISIVMLLMALFFFLRPRKNTPAVVPSVVYQPPTRLDSTMIGELPEVAYEVSKVIDNPLMSHTQIITPNRVGEVRLTVIHAANKEYLGMTMPLTKFPFIIGRDSAAADLALTDNTVSRQHTVITVDKGIYYLADQGSSNGTLLNGMRISAMMPHKLMPGSEIMVGSTVKLIFGFERPPDMPEMTGQMIAFRYKLAEKLHQSGKAAVYKARDQKMNRDVAVKVLSPDLTEAHGYEQQFEQEIKAASSLSHPHVIQIFDFGRDRMKKAAGAEVEFNYIVMQLLGGGTLETRLQREITPTEALVWLKTLAQALDYVHRQNMIHSGLKPGSIVFDAEGHPYVTDFAIAQELGKDSERTLIGAPLFIAPEQWDDQTLSPKVDQYALSVLAYRMLTGMYPYPNMDSPTQRETHWKQGCRPAHEAAKEHNRRDLAPKVSTVLAKALEREPDKRYTTVLEFVGALEVALVQTVITEIAAAKVDVAPKPEPLDAKPSAKKDVFISYRRTTSAMLALHIGTQLEEKYQISAFVDTRSLDGASKFPQRLKNAIENCEVFVCLLADTTLESDWVLEEIGAAREFNKPMIPIFQESFSQPTDAQEPVATLLEYDGLKVLDKQNMYVEHMVGDLAKMVRQSIGKPKS
jgi:serine/threonine protein kinase